MRDETFTLEPAAAVAEPPFSYGYVPVRRGAFWILREACGRRVGRADTRKGARAGVKALYAAHRHPQSPAAVPGFASAGDALTCALNTLPSFAGFCVFLAGCRLIWSI